MAWWKRRYVGTVSARTVYVNRKGETIRGAVEFGRWILTEGVFGRRAKLIGDPGASALVDIKRSAVKAWLAGGPLPDLDEETRPRGPAPVLRIVKSGE
ncbi:hypothetical protein [Stappia indica]|uniref:hypothetical protein n=1 Tax=Stappia indica TaxID=538381 RepID=UPI001CD376A7|nr:hypothetical protein [Stappia indica]MCA1298028.1 hypothetical protein [Stappia indica]